MSAPGSLGDASVLVARKGNASCDLDGEGGMLDPFASEEVFEPVQDRSGLPPGVQEALDHYQGLIAARDLGGVSLYRLTLGSALWTYLLRVTTDGDDGWTLYSEPAAPVVQYEHTVVATEREAVIVTLPG